MPELQMSQIFVMFAFLELILKKDMLYNALMLI